MYGIVQSIYGQNFKKLLYMSDEQTQIAGFLQI